VGEGEVSSTVSSRAGADGEREWSDEPYWPGKEGGREEGVEKCLARYRSSVLNR